MINLVAFMTGIYVFICCFDRLRQINWKTARPPVVLMYLAFAVWSAGAVYFSLENEVHFYQMCGALGIVAMLSITRPAWKAGVPRGIKTDYGDLGALEERRYDHT